MRTPEPLTICATWRSWRSQT